MKRLLAVLFVLCATPAFAYDAAQYYNAACSTCHGPGGAGDGPVSAALPVKPTSFADPAFWASRDDAIVEKVIREGGAAVGKSPLMAPIGANLAPAEMTALIAYLKAFVPSAGAADPKPKAAPAKPTPDTQGASFIRHTRPEVNVALGATLYRTQCAVCHGRDGDGRGPAARGMDPRPRDLVAGVYRFTSTPMGEPAAREDIFRVITHGIRGTAMPGWRGLTADERWQLVYHMESLSPRFADGPGESFDIPPSPRPSAASIALGEHVFASSGCTACHGADGSGAGVPRLTDAEGRRIRPADMTRGWRFKGGSSPTDIFRTLTAGIEGTPMPSFAHLGLDERWALVHWIREQFADADVSL